VLRCRENESHTIQKCRLLSLLLVVGKKRIEFIAAAAAARACSSDSSPVELIEELMYGKA
jgi:hypothetical protein